MCNSDKWIDRVATEVLNLSTEEAADITRFILDGRRGKGLRLRIYWDNLGAEDVIDILPTDRGYEIVEVEEAEAMNDRMD